MTTTPPTAAELWRAAQREGRDVRKRVVAALGIAASIAAAYAVGVASHLFAGTAIGAVPWMRPLDAIFDPLLDAWRTDRDVVLALLLLAHGAAQMVVGARFGGELHRLAIVDLSGGPREAGEDARRFARGRFRTFLGARAAYGAGFVAPIVALIAVALLGRALGGFGVAAAIVAGAALALVAAIVATGWLAGGFLAGPIVAAEGADAFEAVTRSYGYAVEGWVELSARRAWFGLGVVFGTLQRALVASFALLIGHATLSIGAPEAWARVRAILAEGGLPSDAARLGLGWGDRIAALLTLAVLAALAMYVLADFVARIACARSAVYLVTRRAHDRIPVGVLRVAPRVREATRAEDAGFREVVRLPEEDG